MHGSANNLLWELKRKMAKIVATYHPQIMNQRRWIQKSYTRLDKFKFLDFEIYEYVLCAQHNIGYISIAVIITPIDRPYCIDPFHVCGNAAKLENKTKEIFASVKHLIFLYSRLAAFPQTWKESIVEWGISYEEGLYMYPGENPYRNLQVEDPQGF